MALSLTALFTGIVQLFGNSGAGFGGKPFTLGTPQNTNAPPPTSVALSSGHNTVTVPTGYTVYGAWIVPDAASTNIKTLKGVNGDTGTVQAFGYVPGFVWCSSGGTFVIDSVGAEMVQIIYV